MTLREYMTLNNLSLSAFAAQAGLHISTASRAANHRVIPSRETISAVVKATGGKVTAGDFYTEPNGRFPAEQVAAE